MKDLLAIIGGLVLALNLIKLLFDLVPKLGAMRASAYRALSDRIKHKALEKRAIASDIENVVNNSVVLLGKELPPGWINRVRIQWVRSESPDDLHEGDLILRIRPLESQDTNLVNAIYLFFRKVLFPGVKEVLPRTPREAAILHLSRRTILRHHPYSAADLERSYLEPAIRDDPQVAYFLGNYDTIDQRGFFTSVFVREVSDLAQRVRYSDKRARIADELDGILKHLASFTPATQKRPDEVWRRSTDTSSYAFILVARPSSHHTGGYVNRGNSHAQAGINRLYLLGANQERSFVRAVIRDIASDTPYTLVELFETYRDYRGEPGGICAVFDLSQSRRSAERAIGDFFDSAPPA